MASGRTRHPQAAHARWIAIAAGFATSVIGLAGIGAAKGAILGTCDSDYAADVAPVGTVGIDVHPPEPPFLGCGMTFRMADGGTQHLAPPPDWSIAFVAVLVLGVALVIVGAASEIRRQGRLRPRPHPSGEG